jgi:chromosomal replication initiator protein
MEELTKQLKALNKANQQWRHNGKVNHIDASVKFRNYHRNKTRLEKNKSLDNKPKEYIIQMEIMLDIVSENFMLSPEEIKGHSRLEEKVLARHIFCHLAKRYLQIPFVAIGAFLGGRDHSTIVTAVNRNYERIIYNHPDMEFRIDEMIKQYENFKKK